MAAATDNSLPKPPESLGFGSSPFFRFWFVLTVVDLTGLILLQLADLTRNWMIERIAATGRGRLELYSSSLLDTLEKYRPLPYLLARDSRVRDLLEQKIPAIRVNPHLEDFGHSANALIFVMDRTGTTVASSNWRTDRSLVGANFSFRPYFQDARNSIPGGYYAVGIKTGRPGFFLSYPILKTGKLLGVVVVKVDLEKLQRHWRDSGETVMVSDSHGVLFLSSRPEWRYRALRSLPASTIRRLQATQYPNRSLDHLGIRREVREEGNLLYVEDREYLELSKQLTTFGWRIHYLADTGPVHLAFRGSFGVGGVVLVSLMLTLLLLRERRLKQLSRRAAREAEAIRQVNLRLEREIRQHQRTEATLKETQQELIQAGKLAALGRMSAAIVHELNQPVTAIRTFLASARILLSRHRHDQVEATLDQIEELTDRMAAITSQLKIFSRKGEQPTETQQQLFDLSSCILRVCGFWELELQRRKIRLITDLCEPEQAMVRGNELQMEQVVQNLLNNGMDSCSGAVSATITLRLQLENEEVVLTCHDNGPGLSQESLESLFEPFYTTKEVGQGLGLGLAICYGIVTEMNGTIRAENHPEGGGLLTIRLPRDPTPSTSQEATT